MRTWNTFGAFGDTVIELTWREWLGLAFGREIDVSYSSVVVSLGRSKQKAMGQARSREEQLANPGYPYCL